MTHDLNIKSVLLFLISRHKGLVISEINLGTLKTEE